MLRYPFFHTCYTHQSTTHLLPLAFSLLFSLLPHFSFLISLLSRFTLLLTLPRVFLQFITPSPAQKYEPHPIMTDMCNRSLYLSVCRSCSLLYRSCSLVVLEKAVRVGYACNVLRP